MSVCKRHQPAVPCCSDPCHDGTLCTRVAGCDGGGVGFAVEIKETVSGTVVASYTSSDYAAGYVDCTTLAGDTAYTITVSKAPRWRSFPWSFHSPCKATAWHVDMDMGSVPAEGYLCGCSGVGCHDPVKLPLTMNDGLGDVELGVPVFSACATRPAASGATGCCNTVDPYTGLTPLGPIDTPVQFAAFLIGCELTAGDRHTCLAAVGVSPYTGATLTSLVLAAGDCDAEPCIDGTGSPVFTPCGHLAATGPPTVTSCDPFRAEQSFTVTGCMTEIYGSAVTLVLTEAP
jgi:hypothetical protein